MSIRFITNLAVLLAAGFVVISSQVFAVTTTGWIAFGVALGVLVLLALAPRSPMRGELQGAFDLVTAAFAAWTAVAAMAFSGSLLMWLSFANALGLAALAIVGLLAHELSTERVVHSLATADAGTRNGAKSTQRHTAAA
jgi:hypothetical protein